MYTDLNEEKVVCSVCDEIYFVSQTKLLDVDSLPSSFFTEYRHPTPTEELPGEHDLVISDNCSSFRGRGKPAVSKSSSSCLRDTSLS